MWLDLVWSNAAISWTPVTRFFSKTREAGTSPTYNYIITCLLLHFKHSQAISLTHSPLLLFNIFLLLKFLKTTLHMSPPPPPIVLWKPSFFSVCYFTNTRMHDITCCLVLDSTLNTSYLYLCKQCFRGEVVNKSYTLTSYKKLITKIWFINLKVEVEIILKMVTKQSFCFR